MIVWWSSTWLSTDPSAYFVPGCVTACSTASEMATPREPGCFGLPARTWRPAAVFSEGEGVTLAPNSSIKVRRKGFCSYEERTMYTAHSTPKRWAAYASAVPH